jgi:hypothetical protein
MTSAADLIEKARRDLESAARLAAQSGVAGLAASREPLERSARQFAAAVNLLRADPLSRESRARHAFERFQAQARVSVALHRSAATLCARWSGSWNAGQAYEPAGGARPVEPVSRGRRFSLQA